jgi:hypothetical protein
VCIYEGEKLGVNTGCVFMNKLGVNNLGVNNLGVYFNAAGQKNWVCISTPLVKELGVCSTPRS